MYTTEQRRHVASLAHATAHEIVALRSVLAVLRGESTLDDVLSALNSRIAAAEQRLTLMAAEQGVGHA